MDTTSLPYVGGEGGKVGGMTNVQKQMLVQGHIARREEVFAQHVALELQRIAVEKVLEATGADDADEEDEPLEFPGDDSAPTTLTRSLEMTDPQQLVSSLTAAQMQQLEGSVIDLSDAHVRESLNSLFLIEEMADLRALGLTEEEKEGMVQRALQKYVLAAQAAVEKRRKKEESGGEEPEQPPMGRGFGGRGLGH